MDLNQSELNQNQSDSENSLEEEDEPPIDFKSSAQIRFESVLLKRFAKGCLLISFVLFIGQIIVASTTWHRQESSILNGFCFSFLLFFTWLSIMSIFSDSLPQKIKVLHTVMKENKHTPSLMVFCFDDFNHLPKEKI